MQRKATPVFPLFPLSALRRAVPLVLGAVVLAALALPSAPAQAEISAANKKSTKNTSTSIGGADPASTSGPSANASESYNQLVTAYARLLDTLRTDRERAAALRSALDAGDPTVSESEYVALRDRIETDQRTADVLYDAIANYHKDADDQDDDYGGSDGSGQGGSQAGMKDQLVNSIVQQMMMNGMGGMGGLNPLNNMQNLITGNVGGMGFAGGSAPPGYFPPAPPPPAETPAPAKKKESCKIPSKTGSQTADNPGKAADDRTGAGSSFSSPESAAAASVTGSQTADNPGKAADDVAQEECEAADYTTPTPTGKGIRPDKITSLGQAENYVGAFHGRNQECAALTKTFAPEVGAASGWRQGDLVKGNTSIPIGTPIATFNFGSNYGPANSPGGISGGSHTGIYLGQNSIGVKMLHQYNGRPAFISTIPWGSWSGNAREGGNMYYTIRTGTSLNDIIPLLQPVVVALNLVPADAGLANPFPLPYNQL